MLFDIASTFVSYMEAGGYVMPPLVVATLVLWFGIGYRLSVLRGGSSNNVRELLRQAQTNDLTPNPSVIERAVVRAVEVTRTTRHNLREALDDALGEFHQELKRFRVLIRSVVAVAPILGLLGTVTGMIETFASLNAMSLYTQSGGIAGGISQALFTTQLGLAVAIPGLILRGLMERRQERIETDLLRLRDILCEGDNR